LPSSRANETDVQWSIIGGNLVRWAFVRNTLGSHITDNSLYNYDKEKKVFYKHAWHLDVFLTPLALVQNLTFSLI